MAANEIPQINQFQPNTSNPNFTPGLSTVVNTADHFIREPVHFPFRKLEIKRRQLSDGLYESDWFDITEYVERWGQIKTAVDDVRLNRFTHDGITIKIKNDHGEFNPEHEGQSLFNGFLTRNRTLFRVQAGYTDGSGNQFPSDPTQGIFLLEGDIDIKPNINTVDLKCKSLVSIFERTRADEITGISTSITASEIFEKIRDATDGSSNLLFRTFITSTSWTIQSTTTIYDNLGTTTALEEFSTWELMNKLAETEGFVISITRTGGIEFTDRKANQDDPQYSLIGAGFRDPNIIKIGSYKEAIDKLYTHIRFQYQRDDTVTSFIEAGTNTTIDERSLEWKYGRRTYEFENTFFQDTGSAQKVVSNLVGLLSNLRSELNVDCLFMPHLNVLDRVDVNYQEISTNSIQLWDQRDWASDTTTSDTGPTLSWASETSSVIDFNRKNFKILSRKTDLDKFVTNFQLREAEN